MPFLGYRTSPRTRHDASPLVVLLLRPFFRYSEWRKAWVLRIVGERYGPVLRVPPGRERTQRERREDSGRSPHVLDRRPSRSARTRAPTWLLVASGIAVAAILGFVIATVANSGSSGPSLGKPVSAGALEVSFPGGWQVRSTGLPLGLTDGIGAVSGARLIATGTATTTDASLLPASILASVQKPLRGEVVTLRGTTFYRYSDLSLRGQTGSQTIYATPTANGTVLAVCQTPAPDGGFASTCQRVVESIQLRSGSLSPGLVPAYAAKLRTVISQLNEARDRWGSQLSTTQASDTKATAATALATAHAQAATALEKLDPGPARSGNNALVAELQTAAAAYTALARATSSGQIGDYGSATTRVVAANDALRSALAALRSFGYPVG